jgi:mannose-6-phosphate isomerase-like protein (cupin superfamily)
VKPIDDACGKIQEMYNSKDWSISYATIVNKAKPHMHKIMEEVYFVAKGAGRIVIDGNSFNIGPGDIMPIPKNKIHYVENSSSKPVELIVVTHPGFIPSDVIEMKI